jgi:poly-gamma-glutamate capsule biosynthesis protein CapA/YwtB (metallophosphatase superfamily)
MQSIFLCQLSQLSQILRRQMPLFSVSKKLSVPTLALLLTITVAGPAKAQAQPQAAAASTDDLITISAVGDIMMGTTYPSNLLPADQGKSLFREMSPYMQNSDIRFGNFEGTLFDGPPQPDGKAPGPKRYLFKSPTTYVERLTEAKFNVVSLANNHAKDFGQAGLQSTKDILSLAGIQWSAKDGGVAHFNIRGVSVALIATDFYPGFRSLTQPERMLKEIAELKKKFQVVIVSAHAGAEGPGAQTTPNKAEIYLGENRGNSVAFARSAIDAGADLLIMHGPHVPRGLEVYRNRLVIYSLGNFATGAGIDVSGIAGLAPLINVQIDGQGHFVQAQIHSFIQDRRRGTVLDPKAQALQLMKKVSSVDFPDSSPSFSEDGLLTP